MKALVLGGGSIKGAFQAGAIAEVLRRGWWPDAVYGVSVGALNGAYVASRTGDSLLSQDTNATEDDVQSTWQSVADDLESFWRRNVTSFAALGKRRSLLSLIWHIAWSRFDGLLKMDGLNDLVAREISPSSLRASPIKFTAFSVNIADGQLVRATGDSPDVCRYILASTRIPVVMPIERIGNQPLLDGGIRDVAPLRHAINAGADDIVAILCHPRDVSGACVRDTNLLQLVSRLMEIIVNEILTNDIAHALRVNQAVAAGSDTKHKKLKVTEIRPDKPLDIDLEKFSSTQISCLLEQGAAAARKEMPKQHA